MRARATKYAAARFVSISLALVTWLGVRPALAAEPAKDLPSDATLARLIGQTLAALPELSGGEHLAQAQAARVSRAAAWPDPFLQLGIQNDGFKSIQVGMMETSFVSLMASQNIPWPGKTRLRESIAELEATGARQGVARMRLSAEAFVRSNYLDLMWVRDRRALFEQRLSLWQRALDAALVRYEAGTGAQVDALRAKLELMRLEQQRALLDAEEADRIRALNRARQHPLDEPIPTERTVRELPPLAGLETQFSAERAVARSPELAAARTQIARASQQLELADKGNAPDLTFAAGFMYRGSLPPMWLLSVGAPVPLPGGSKRSAAVNESRALEHATQNQLQMVEQLVRLRSVERRNQFIALARTLELYEHGILAQSATTADAMVTQYRVGKGAFASVLEANAGLIADQEGYLRVRVDAERLLIAEREVSLQASGLPSASGGAASMSSGMNSNEAPAAVAPAAASVSGGTAPTSGSASGSAMSSM